MPPQPRRAKKVAERKFSTSSAFTPSAVSDSSMQASAATLSFCKRVTSSFKPLIHHAEEALPCACRAQNAAKKPASRSGSAQCAMPWSRKAEQKRMSTSLTSRSLSMPPSAPSRSRCRISGLVVGVRSPARRTPSRQTSHSADMVKASHRPSLQSSMRVSLKRRNKSSIHAGRSTPGSEPRSLRMTQCRVSVMSRRRSISATSRRAFMSASVSAMNQSSSRPSPLSSGCWSIASRSSSRCERPHTLCAAFSSRSRCKTARNSSKRMRPRVSSSR
jgi:hypothetical protein